MTYHLGGRTTANPEQAREARQFVRDLARQKLTEEQRISNCIEALMIVNFAREIDAWREGSASS